MTFMSTGKILTKAKILNLIAFIHLKKTPEKKNPKPTQLNPISSF